MKEKLRLPAKAEGRAWLPVLRSMLSHHHDELELNLVLSGRAAYLFGRRRVPLVTGSMIWIFPRQEHVLIDRSSDYSMWILVFKPGLVRRHAGTGERRVLRSLDPGAIFCRQIDYAKVERLNQVYRDAHNESHDLEFNNAALSYALVTSWQVYQTSHDSSSRTDVHPAVAKAAQILSQGDASIPLVPLARQAGLSPARLSRLFKLQTGVSLTMFRQRECLKRFLGLYRTGARYSLIEAAFQAGFGSYPQFHRVFRKTMGISPAQYKKNVSIPAVA